MSAAGTPSTDPWLILARERARYEEQFKSLKPNNGIVTGEQAKGFFLQSQLPPIVLGQIWALADTDSDGKMDINEFSIACKLINLKLRGFEVPKGLPPSLLASLKIQASPPAIPPLPNSHLVHAAAPPSRPEPPKMAPTVAPAVTSYVPPVQPLITAAVQPPLIQNTQPLISTMTQPLVTQPLMNQPLMPGLSGTMNTTMPTMPPVAPTGIVPSAANTAAPLMQPINVSPTMQPLAVGVPPLIGSAPSAVPIASFQSAPGIIPSAQVSAVPPASSPALSGSIGPLSPVGSIGGGILGGSIATSTPRASIASIASLDRVASVESGIGSEWGVPHQTKLKYTQIFNTIDKTRSGFLSGPQARNIMVQTKLPQGVLAQIWALADMDADGRLGSEEFVLAMHLCEQAQAGVPPPAKLLPDLIPPSFRRGARTASISSQGSTVHADQDPASTLPQTSFEDKRKENYEKGQAELDRRRKTLMDQQRKEAEERERKEREEQERKEKARQEAERKRMEEMEKLMREQQEKERLIEEERKRQAEQREAARKEMERQRQLEWEKQRLQELQQQRQREQETLLKLKAKNQSLTIELSSLNTQVKDLSQKICDTRLGVSNVKTTIDGMRTTRDTQMQEMAQLKAKLKDQNSKLLALSQEKIKLEAKNKINIQDPEQTKLAFENKEITIKNLKEKLADMNVQIDSKLSDISNNNSLLNDLKGEMAGLLEELNNYYETYDKKRNMILEMKQSFKNDDWGTKDGWADKEEPPTDLTGLPGVHQYRAIYEFKARNKDEISFQPDDLINVPTQKINEPGWLAGEIHGHTGWFPEAYAEPVDGIGLGLTGIPTETTQEYEYEQSEANNNNNVDNNDNNFGNDAAEQEVKQINQQLAETAIGDTFENEPEYYVANYPYQSQEPGDLSFNAGDIIGVYKKDGEWWTGKLKEEIGIFPSNYVQKVDVNATQPSETPFATNDSVTQPSAVAPAGAADTAPPTAGAASTATPVTASVSTHVPSTSAQGGVSAAAVTSALENISNANTIVDNEVSQINENKMADRQPAERDLSSAASSQILKGKKPEIASVIAPYQATSAEQLSLARGQLIMIRKKTDSGWWEGELQAKGRKRQVGWFPASYVKILNSSGKISGRTTPVSMSRMQQEIVIDKVVALYPYTANNPDELSFLKDDIINVTARDEEAWWRGELNGVSGLFPSNYVTPLQQNQSTEDKKRIEAINELIQTEYAYIEDMTIVHDVFEMPLRKSKIISMHEIDEIFVNCQDILQCNKNFLKDLKQQYITEGKYDIGHIICQHLPKMTAYVIFCGKQLDSATLLQQLTESSTAFRELVKKCQGNYKTKGMPLSSFLLKPMQRITRYPLLINKILENTPENHTDYKPLQEASKLAEKFLSCINENVRVKENQERMNWLQQYIQNDLNLTFNSSTNKLGPRQLLHFGSFTKLKTGKDLLGFLFNDFFMLVQPNKTISGQQFLFQRNNNIVYKMYKQPILIQHLQITRESTESVEYGTDSNRVIKLQDEKSGYKIFLLASTVHECSTWAKKIDTAKQAYQKIDQLNRLNKRKTQLHLGPTCGRLLVLVQKGKRLLLSGKSHSDSIYCKVTLGNQEQQTDFAKDSLNNTNFTASQNNTVPPEVPILIWNHSMQFQLRNLNAEILTFSVLEYNPYCVDEFLGKAELKLKDLYEESQNTNGPITKKLVLHQAESGEIIVKLDLHMFNM